MSKFLTSSKDINLINGTADLNVNSITATTTNFADGGGGGGSGGISYDAGTFEQENGIVFRNGTDADKVKNVSYFGLVNLPVIGESLLCNDVQFPNVYSAETSITENTNKLTQISYDDTDPLNPFTKIDGELDVDKIKNTTGTAEVQLETDGKINIQGDGQLKIRANGSTGTYENALLLESDTNCYITTSQGIYLNAFAPDNTTPNLTLNTVNGILTVQAINGHIHNSTKGLIRLENIAPQGSGPELNGFIFNPDAVSVNLNKLDVSKGSLGLDINDNVILHSTNTLTLSAVGFVLCDKPPSLPTSVVNRSYVDSQGFSPVPLSMCDYVIPTQTSQFYYTTQATHNLNLNNMSIYTNGASTGNVYVAVYRGALGATPRPFRIAYGTINTAGGVIRSTTLLPNNVEIVKGEELTIGLYSTTTSVDILAFYGNLSNNSISAYTSSDIQTGEMPFNPPLGMGGSSYGNARFGCMLY